MNRGKKRRGKLTALLIVLLLILQFTNTAYAYTNRSGVMIRGGQGVFVENASTGKLIIGDSRCCQLYQFNPGGASFAAVWGGHFTCAPDENRKLYSESRINFMKTCVRDSLKEKHGCDVYLFASVNDYNGERAFNATAQSSIDMLAAFAKTLRGVTYTEADGSVYTANVHVLSLVGYSDTSIQSNIDYYNRQLKAKINGLGDAKITYENIDTSEYIIDYRYDCCHYEDRTLTALWGKINAGSERDDFHYQTSQQSHGLLYPAGNGETSGIIGKSLRLEGLSVTLPKGTSGSVQYRSYLQGLGWQAWKQNGALSGGENTGTRVEAVQIKLTGSAAQTYDIYYRVYSQVYGWLGWAKNGETSGTIGYSYRTEAIQIKLVKKGLTAPGTRVSHCVEKGTGPLSNCTAYVQSIGWKATVNDGITIGNPSQGFRIEAVKLTLSRVTQAAVSQNGTVVSTTESGIAYKSYIQKQGWESGWKYNGAVSGTMGKSLRMEAICIRLTGAVSNNYDIYYRVYSAKFGWMGWTKNGARAGSTGYASAITGLQILVVKKGERAPVSSSTAFKEK